MSEDRTLFGSGRYPDSGLLAILARVAFLVAVVAIVIAVFLPSKMVPQFLRSHYLEHFAAFYVAFLTALCAVPRLQLRRMAIAFGIGATLLEATHLGSGAQFAPLMLNWIADIGGLAAATAPIVVERFRRRFHLAP